MVRQREKRVRRSRDAPAEARHFVAESLSRVLGPSSAARLAVADAELVVSELVTNAITARCTQAVVRLILDDDRLEVWVWDDGNGTPAPRTAEVYDTSGRGLIIVSALAQQWAVEQQADGTKWVWARLPLPRAIVPAGDFPDPVPS